MDPWLSLPVELIIRILRAAAQDNPDTLLKFAQTSKRNHAIATDDTAWLLVLSDIFYKHSSPSTKIDSATLSRYRNWVLPNAVDRRFIFRDFYLRLIAPHRWLLGWWLVQTFEAGYRGLYRVILQPNLDDPWKEFCLITGHKVFGSYDTHNLPDPMPSNIRYYRDIYRPGGCFVVNLPGRHVSIYGNNPTQFNRPEHPAFTIDSRRQCLSNLRTRGVISSPSPVQHRIPAWKEDDRRPSSELFNGRSFSLYTRFGDAPFPSPLALPVVRDVSYDHDTSIPIVPGTAFDFGDSGRRGIRPSTPIYPPSHFSSNDDHLGSVILSHGIYATNGAEGLRFVYVRTRELTAEDFAETWAWEGTFASCGDKPQVLNESEVDWADPDIHLGPFSRMRCMLMPTRFGALVSEDHVKEGARIIEVVKLAGSGAPTGQRVVTAFLDDPRVIPEELQAVSLACSHMDLKGEDGPKLPWPIKSKAVSDPSLPPTADSLFQRMFTPERGIDLPAVARVARAGFVQPSWIDVVMHIESKDQFSVYWRDLDYAEIWTKMYDQ